MLYKLFRFSLLEFCTSVSGLPFFVFFFFAFAFAFAIIIHILRHLPVSLLYL